MSRIASVFCSWLSASSLLLVNSPSSSNELPDLQAVLCSMQASEIEQVLQNLDEHFAATQHVTVHYFAVSSGTNPVALTLTFDNVDKDAERLRSALQDYARHNGLEVAFKKQTSGAIVDYSDCAG